MKLESEHAQETRVFSLSETEGSQISTLLNRRGVRQVLGSVFKLGVGEAISRVASFLLFAYLSRHFSVELLGAIALSQTIALYVTLGTDQGVRLAGARLVARDNSAAPTVIRAILPKRLFSCIVCVILGSAYALYGPVPQFSRYYILGFVLAVIPYAFSLDWLAWGLNKFAWLGGFRAGVSVILLVGAVAGISLTKTTLFPITIANAVAAGTGALALWVAWRFRWKMELPAQDGLATHPVRSDIRWAVILPLGLATILNQAFHCFDTILLGAMSTAAELGRYTSAYKVLFLILGSYWLLTNSLYPRLSRVRHERGAQGLLFRSLAAVGITGAFLSVILYVSARQILILVYGSDLGATTLLKILVFAIPMDFCISLVTVVLISRGLDRAVLYAIGSAAAVNIALNLYLIPQYQGTGAAIATIVAYVYLLSFFFLYIAWNPVFSTDSALAPANPGRTL